MHTVKSLKYGNTKKSFKNVGSRIKTSIVFIKTPVHNLNVTENEWK